MSSLHGSPRATIEDTPAYPRRMGRAGLCRGGVWLDIVLVGLAAAFFAVSTLAASPQKSAAFDEQYHLTSGYTYLRTGDYRLATTHPPLVGLWAALPLLWTQDITLPLDDPAWAEADRFAFSDQFLWEANRASAVQILEWARVPVVVLGIVLLAAIYAWAFELWGRAGAALALLLAATDPALLSNARVVTTDLGVTLFLFLAFWQLWRGLEKRRWDAWLLSGVFGGLALGAKYSGGLYVVAAIVAVTVYVSPSGERLPSRLAKLAGAMLVALGVLWALYRFDVGTAALPFWPWPLPAPYYWEQLWRTVFVLTGDPKLDFLLGEAGGGWWYYFLVAAAVKTPLPLLILGNVGLARLLRSPLAPRRDVLWIMPLLVLLLALTGVLTIGYRHLLPALPFLMVAAGAVTTWHMPQGGWQRLGSFGLAALMGWSVVNAVRFFPHHEAYFNELAGPWPRWSSILVDSNLDWGQDLPSLAKLIDERGIEQVNLAYFGKAVPEVYGVRYTPLPGYLRFVLGPELDAYNPYTPEPGWYAISATSLRLGLLKPDSVDLYAYFRSLTPVDRAGYSIYLYEVSYPPETAVARPVVIGTSVAQCTPQELGILPGQRSQVKWVQSSEAEVYPLGNGFAPPSVFHRVDTNFAGCLTLIGYTLAPETPHPGDTLTITLYWRVGHSPLASPSPTRGNPLSAFVHVTADDPTVIVAQYDGWRTALRGLEPDDIIAHHLTIALPADLLPGEYRLLAGLYSPQSGMRWEVAGAAPAQHTELSRFRVE